MRCWSCSGCWPLDPRTGVSDTCRPESAVCLCSALASPTGFSPDRHHEHDVPMARSSKLGLCLLTDDLHGRRRGPGCRCCSGPDGTTLPLGSLTERAADVLRLMAEGMSVKGIAA